MTTTPRSASSIIAEHASVVGEREATERQLTDLNAQIAPLNTVRAECLIALQRAEKRLRELRTEYRAATGFDLRKATRPVTLAVVEKAHGELLAAMCEPANLPADDLIVQARLVAYQFAMQAHQQWKALRKAGEPIPRSN